MEAKTFKNLTEFTIVITETLVKNIKVSASTKEAALQKVKLMYGTEKITLTPDDFCDVTFEYY